MRPRSIVIPNAVAAFGEKLSTSLAAGTFVRLVLSGHRPATDGPDKVFGRCIDLHSQPHLSLTFRYASRDEVKNLSVAEGTSWVLKRLGFDFGSALLCTTENDWQLSHGRDGQARLMRHRPSTTVPPDRQHDQTRRSILDDSAQDWLSGLGVTDANGRVRPAMADKYAQINRYLEILSHLGRELGWTKGLNTASSTPWTLADMGCGKGYLTFGLWHLFRRISGLAVEVVGIEARPELAASTNRLARAIGAQGLQFLCGTIESIELAPLRGLIALHACNTATDDAIAHGIRAGAELIVVAPCCHHQLRAQLSGPALLQPVLRHGILAERMAEWATDGLRALYLEWAGYRTKVFEFVSSEHTAKNLMISAIRHQAPFSDPTTRRRIEEIKAFFGIHSHALDVLLT